MSLRYLKRYLVFAGATYYASGGWNDFRSSWDTVEEAHMEALRLYREGYRVPSFSDRFPDFTEKADWWQVIDGVDGEMVGFSGWTQS